MASPSYNFLLNQWKMRKIDEAGLQVQVTRNHITQAEYDTIINTPQASMSAAEEPPAV
jgi:hypothetical protein